MKEPGWGRGKGKDRQPTSYSIKSLWPWVEVGVCMGKEKGKAGNATIYLTNVNKCAKISAYLFWT